MHRKGTAELYRHPVATEDDVRELALALPDTIEKPSYGTPGFRVKDRPFARIREEGVLAIWCESLEEKDFLIEGDPELGELLAESARTRSG